MGAAGESRGGEERARFFRRAVGVARVLSAIGAGIGEEQTAMHRLKGFLNRMHHAESTAVLFRSDAILV